MPREAVRALLRAQLEDLSRLRHLTDAQAAILAMADLSLLEQMRREADQLVADIVRRDAELVGVAATEGSESGDLHSQVDAAAERARRAIERLTRRMEEERDQHREQLAAVEREWEQLAGGYTFQRARIPAPAPSFLDRVG